MFDQGPDRGSLYGSAMARWRSYRQIHRIFFVCFLLFTIFVIDRYRVELAGTFTLPDRQGGAVQPEPGNERLDESMMAAGNSTLGFHKILYLNMKVRYDREDAMALQSYISGVDIEDYAGVEFDMIDPVGMPPSHRPSVFKAGERGCWRAHANIWSDMVRKKLPPVLIIESDATWDINVRPIMMDLNKYFVQFLRQINSTAVHDPSYGSKNNRHPMADSPFTIQRRNFGEPNATATPPPPIEYNPDDPWLSEHWDLFSLGQCFEHGQDKDIKLIYPDPRVPAGKDYWGTKLGNERVVRKSGGITCTTAYAISHTGAAKLLMRSAVDLDNPVDLLIRRLTLSRDLVAYSVMPPILAQWEYRHDVGQSERGAQSDINGGKHKDTPPDTNMPGWPEVNQTGSVWITKGHHRDVTFDKMALKVAWQQILGEGVLSNSWWNPKTRD
ncbi:hypothetical protein OQA88_5539 [Cercophora sp. LCS_1]